MRAAPIYPLTINYVLSGRELSLVGISAEDGRDEAGRERFHIFTMEQLMATDNQALVASHSRTSLRPVRQVGQLALYFSLTCIFKPLLDKENLI